MFEKIKKAFGLIDQQQMADIIKTGIAAGVAEAVGKKEEERKSVKASLEEKDGIIHDLEQKLQSEREQTKEAQISLTAKIDGLQQRLDDEAARNTEQAKGYDERIDNLQKLLASAKEEGYHEFLKKTRIYYDKFHENEVKKPKSIKCKFTLPVALNNELNYVAKALGMNKKKSLIVCSAIRRELDMLYEQNKQIFEDIENISDCDSCKLQDFDVEIQKSEGLTCSEEEINEE